MKTVLIAITLSLVIPLAYGRTLESAKTPTQSVIQPRIVKKPLSHSLAADNAHAKRAKATALILYLAHRLSE